MTLARKLRGQPTAPEIRLWRLLYPLRTGGHHFRKQMEIGSYVVDFACLRSHLIIEVDGDTHGTDVARSNDEVRDEYLRERRGFIVLRFTNDEVMRNGDGVLEVIAQALGSKPEIARVSPPPHPSPQGGGWQRAARAGDPLPSAASPPGATPWTP